MPEGDALHRAAARFRPLVGRRVTASSPHPRGRATGVAAAVDGRTLEAVEAVGKHLLLRFSGGVTLRSHLRMNGRWVVGPTRRAYNGLPWLVLRAGEIEAAQWHGPVLTLDQRALHLVGPDLLSDASEPTALAGRMRATDPSRPLGEVMQDQRLVAGIGNMWMSEILWAVSISPWLTVGETLDDELVGALRTARDEMRAAVAGSRPRRSVYRRAGRPCVRCGTAILSRGQGDNNRTAYWCPGCQRGPATAAG